MFEHWKDYTPQKNGAIVAIKIYLKYGYQPMATLKSAFGSKYSIHWDVIEERQVFLPGINAYTVFFDQRANERKFEDM